MNRTLGIAAVAALAVTSLGLSRLDRSALQVQGARNVTVVATDYAFSAPTVINAGWIRMNMINRGAEPHQVQILVSDGLSAEAVHHNQADLIPVLLDGLAGRRLTVGVGASGGAAVWIMPPWRASLPP
jgi:hypothetical protein